MMDFLKVLFRLKKSVEQTGVIHEMRPTDYLAGTIEHEAIVENRDWTLYEPDQEEQSIPFVFDTMACVPFSFLNSLETQLNYQLFNNLMSPLHKNFLYEKGYIKNGKVNFSDRWLAIISKTSKNGNSFIRVADAGRLIGLIPETSFDFGNFKTWEEWHNLNDLRSEMFVLANQFLNFYKISYEWTFIGLLPPEGEKLISDHLKQAPLQISVPVPGKHAIIMTKYSPRYFKVFDSYPPFSKRQTIDKSIDDYVHYAFKIVITEKEVTSDQVTRILRIGDRGEDVKKIQVKLRIVADGVFGPKTKKSVIDFQSSKGLIPDGIVGPKTLNALEDNKLSLVEALVQVESQGNDNAIGDINLPDKAYGPLQIRQPCVDDVNRAFKTNYKAQDMLGNRNLSIWVFERYMELYATSERLKRDVTNEDKARIWNGGPNAWKKPNKSSKIETMLSNYWGKVSRLL